MGGHQHRRTKAYSPAWMHPGAASACASAAQRVIPHLKMGGRYALETFFQGDVSRIVIGSETGYTESRDWRPSRPHPLMTIERP